MSEELQPAPHFDFGPGWAEIEKSALGYRITAGYGSMACEGMWFRLTRKGARRKAQRLIDRANRQHRRHVERERLGWTPNSGRREGE